MKTKGLVLIMGSALFFGSCTPQKAEHSETIINEISDGHTSENSLDWSGSYSGIEPCADCEGIKSTLKLTEDGKYELTTEYLGQENSQKYIKSGDFIWKADGNTIELLSFEEGEASALYKVEENQLRHLDMDGNAVTGELENNYILSKNGNPEVEDMKWQLVELNGKPVDGNADNYYLIFNSAEGMIQTKAGCNTISIPYTIENKFRLTTGNGISTMMACPDMDAEAQLKEAIQKADNISFGDGKLSLNKARMAPFAIFEIVE